MRLIVAFVPVFLAAAAALVRPAAADFNSAVAAYAQGDFTSAFQEFLELARQRDVMAQDIVAMMYHRGNGVPKDDVQAYLWLDLAARAGDRDAAKFRDEMIVPSMTPPDLARAKELSRNSPLAQDGAPTSLAATPHRDPESAGEPPASPRSEQPASSPADPSPPPEAEKSASSDSTASSDPVAAPSSPMASTSPAAPSIAPSRGAAKSSAKRRWAVQVVAVPGKPEAQREWRRLRSRNPDLLRGLTPTVERAGTDTARGSYYRVRVGAWKDKQAPDVLCGKLKRRGERCLVLQRLS
jgi:sporulation related protein/Sel1 repeat-containing protein